MKFLIVFILNAFIFFNNSNEKKYTASTPAGALVRNFLGISVTDSIDFIRWKVSINNDRYSVDCNYGISKPNTNGFYDGGKKVSFAGQILKNKNIYTFKHNKQTLKFIELNGNLLHILNDDNTLMIGGGGWSYTLNVLTPVPNDQLELTPGSTLIKDSIAFQGRTPCRVPHILKSQECYKIKWYLVLYGDPATNEPLTYRVLGTGFRMNGGKRGRWLINNRNDKIYYELLDETGKPQFHLLKLDEGVLIFTDDNGNLLVGDHDFSYTINRKF